MTNCGLENGCRNKVFWNQLVTYFTKTTLSYKGEFLFQKCHFNLCTADSLKHLCFLPIEIQMNTEENSRWESLSSSEILEVQDKAISKPLINISRGGTSPCSEFVAWALSEKLINWCFTHCNPHFQSSSSSPKLLCSCGALQDTNVFKAMIMC